MTPGRAARWLCAVGLLSAVLQARAATADFAATLDALWDYAKPAESETRFRTELAHWPADSPQHAEVVTQMARTQSLRRMFADAHRTLDGAEANLATMPSHVRVRYLLERGRTFNSAGMPERSVPLFEQALELAECAADTFYAIDAAHMLGIAAAEPKRLDWNLRALAMAEKATDARSKRWLAALYNNIGYTYQERGDFTTALDYYRKALPAYQARGDADSVRVAHWMIARAQRSLGQLDEAERTQRMLLAEYDKIGSADGYVFEELAEIAIARGDAAAAAPWAAKAHALLGADTDFVAHNAQRLERLAKLAGIAPAKGAR